MTRSGRVSPHNGGSGGPEISAFGRVFSHSPSERVYRYVLNVTFDPSPCHPDTDQYALTGGVSEIVCVSSQGGPSGTPAISAGCPHFSSLRVNREDKNFRRFRFTPGHSSRTGGDRVTPPLLPAYIASGSQWAIWCPVCGHLHFHGKAPGHREPHCSPGVRVGRHIEGYYLIPTGEPLPPEAKKLDTLGRRRIRNITHAKRPKWTDPQPVPEWGQAIEDRDYALSLLAVWCWKDDGARGEEFKTAMAKWSRVIPDPCSALEGGPSQKDPVGHPCTIPRRCDPSCR